MSNQFKNLIKDNDIVQQALNTEPIDIELYQWLGADILKLSYMKRDLKEGKSKEDVAQFYGVTVEGIDKFINL